MLDRQAGEAEIGGMRQYLLDHALGGQRLDMDLRREQRGIDAGQGIRHQPSGERAVQANSMAGRAAAPIASARARICFNPKRRRSTWA